MTFKQLINPRNFMIILCILAFILLGQKAFLISDKIKAVQEGDRLYAAGDLVAAEKQYREAAANSSIDYKEEEISARLEKLAPITTIRNSLATLALSSREQAATGDFAGLMKSYESLVRVKAQYMKPGSAYESYYRQLSAASGLSKEMTSYFQQFKKQFYSEMEQSRSTIENTDDSSKWNLLLIPDAFYGGAELKQQELTSRFKSHDTKKLVALAAAGQVEEFLNSALSLLNGYKKHDYTANWVAGQAEESGKLILDKDVEGEYITAFAAHALLYRKFAEDAGLASSKVLPLINNSTSKLLKSAGRKARAGQYAEAIQLYGELSPLQDTSEEVTAVHLAWNIAEPVRLLPGGQEPGQYSHVVSSKNLYGSKVYVAGTDISGRLYYAAIKSDDSIVTLTGDTIPGFESLRSLEFNDSLGSLSGLPVVLAEADSDSGRIDFTAYEMKPEGISVLFSLTGDQYELQPDGSIVLQNADIGDGVDGQTALYRIMDGVYQFAEIVQEYTLIPAADLELHPYENVSLNGEIFQDNTGKVLAYSDGLYISLQGDVGSVTGSSMVSGQFQYGYETIVTDTGVLYVPVFVVDSVASQSLAH
ncbi:hypothetical protein PaeBR_04115 [Paenibacillus sp. BR2-3]|uniref:hypothetical protein n=1 Tax=Paenibacillus sp. BR2-3 TaxID=3048494 RepID=UPI0039779058